MDFFNHQDKAKSKTFLLFILFLIGLLILSTITTIAISLVLIFTLDPDYHYQVSPLYIMLMTIGVILLMTLYKYLTLKSGGKAVAESLGGRLIDKRASNSNERKLLNVVEEMAIAASLPVPPVYILDEETNINAFAAGFTINDAVIGVTRGSIDLLDRDELQAVIAHEFSHILNGDMRFNLRFTAIIFGFLFITQIATMVLRIIARTRGAVAKDKRAGAVILAIFLIACILTAAGWLFSLWARIMQAAVNRQREYLADASSVQFTRHGPSLASALKKIGGSAFGSNLITPAASSYNHFFFGQADQSILATHPPLTKRIRRIEPRWNGKYIQPIVIQPEQDATEKDTKEKLSKERIAAAIAAGITVTGGNPLHYLKPTALNSNPTDEEQILQKLEAICQEPMDSCYLIFALLLDDNPDIQQKQLLSIKNADLIKNYHQLLFSIPVDKHLAIIEKSIPALKNISEAQYKIFQKMLMHFINADNIISLPEWLIYQLITHQVGAQYDTKSLRQRDKYHKADQLQEEIGTLISALAWLSPTEQGKKLSFGMGANIMGLYAIQLKEQMPTATELTNSLQKLQEATERVRKKFLQAALRAIEQDQEINADEAFFFRVLSLCLDCPISLETNKNKHS